MSDRQHYRDTTIERPLIFRSGFTLVEILVVLVIIGLMGGMVLAAVRGVTNTARASRTRTIIAACDSVIQEQYESIKYRPLPVEIPDLFATLPSGTVGREVLATEAARVRLVMARDLMKMEIPDRFTDFIESANAPVPSRIWAAANQVKIDSGDIDGDGDFNEYIAIRSQPATRMSFEVTWRASVPAKVSSYRSRFASLSATATPQQILANQSAECLFMIMASSFVGGRPAIATIPSSNIGDTDGDGLNEILDGWGIPLRFIRWPVGYFDPNGTTDTTSKNYYANIPDDFDPFHVDFAYDAGATTSSAVDINNANQTVKPWALRPLIISAGGDEELGIALRAAPVPTATSVANDFAYSNTAWKIPTASGSTVGQNFMGNEFGGRSNANPYCYPDPYLRLYRLADATQPFPGQSLSGAAALEARADNITNYSLQANQ